jgi:hypothetical protein
VYVCVCMCGYVPGCVYMCLSVYVYICEVCMGNVHLGTYVHVRLGIGDDMCVNGFTWVIGHVCPYMCLGVIYAHICVCLGICTPGSHMDVHDLWVCSHVYWGLPAWVCTHMRDSGKSCRRVSFRVKYGAVWI